MMKKYYITNISGESGISKYSRDFFSLILKNGDYIVLDTGCIRKDDIISKLNKEDLIHIEIGSNLFLESEILIFLLKKRFKNVNITMHDAPLIRYPFFRFKNSTLNNLSKVFQIFFKNLYLDRWVYERINRIYVLNRKAKQYLQLNYKLDSIFFLPHIIDPIEISDNFNTGIDFLFFGFIGPNKGIEYALELHNRFIEEFKNSKFSIIGKPLNVKGNNYYNNLKTKFDRNKEFLGYINDINPIFNNVSSVILPFQNYKFMYPTSGSILTALKHGKVVFTTNVNCNNELIEDNVTGFFLSGDIDNDIRLVKSILGDKNKMLQVQQSAVNLIKVNHSPEKVKDYFYF
jgi:glycosyltransferase involved in cell wall biosynthesis